MKVIILQLICIIGLAPYVFAKSLKLECTAVGKLRSVVLSNSGPAYAAELEGLVFNAEETRGMLKLAIFNEDGIGARTEVPISAVTQTESANIALTFINGSPELKCIFK